MSNNIEESKEKAQNLNELTDHFIKLEDTYAIAYANPDGNGFSANQPWVLAEFGDDLAGCKAEAEEMKLDGYGDVTVFKFGSEVPEEIFWDYVKEREI